MANTNQPQETLEKCRECGTRGLATTMIYLSGANAYVCGEDCRKTYLELVDGPTEALRFPEGLALAVAI